MKLSTAFSIVPDLQFAIQAALIPTFHAVLANPFLLLQPTTLSRLFMAKLWLVYGDGVDAAGRPVKEHLITPNAYGVVLDIGAGHGHTAAYLNPDLVTKYVALEPNTAMHPILRSTANAAGFSESDGTLLILSCGAEDLSSVLSSLSGHSIDTLISILTLCSVPSPNATITALVSRALKPGGQLLFYEHVLSPKQDVRWWQRFWAPIWSWVFDGCRMDCQTDIWLYEMAHEDGGGSMWAQRSVWSKEGEPEEHLFYHRVGRMVRHLF